jgi:hypothetical protein
MEDQAQFARGDERHRVADRRIGGDAALEARRWGIVVGDFADQLELPGGVESLSPERFQQMCQALLAACFPNAQCLPVGQPDGGRDAFWAIRNQPTGDSDLYIFQIKFSRTPDRREEDFIQKVCDEEGPKVKRLIERGAKAYYLLTNIKGTAHLDTGSIDKLDSALTPCLGIPSYCWWRDDLDRRIDNEANIKWSYPEIIRGSDLLQALLEGTLGEEGRRRNDALKAYLAAQYRDDQEVKFKQVDLYNSLLDLFVDIPLGMIDSDEAPAGWQTIKVKRHHRLTRSYVYESAETNAAEFLLDSASRADFPRIVLEGAPGQGKSTITHYFCQVNRMRLLNKDSDLARIKVDHNSGSVRVPFRVDLRDYANWLAGKNPFSSDPSTMRPSDSQISLESFLSYQIVHASGGHVFLVSDLTALAKASHISIVLDGFDEVADVSTREQVVREVSRAATRLEATCKSVQVIVTSRPAAFAKSPGFSKEEWRHFSLRSMSLPQINEYAQKWMAARQLSLKDKTDFQQVLEQRLSQPHMRDLARNPMQLAILLNLIQTKGLSLPDKRTALYDSYMDLFFSREAEKSPVVREHRDLLIELHRYLAWVIQTEAEKARSTGSVTEDRLKELLREYLRQEGHSTGLVDGLFTGMIERVVALVSRVQGTFEFEVQPLREYFAARHLYETAPYSPPGSEKKGTKPERFDVLARDFYWLNVTRFYCGCYSRGELSSLADGLTELSKAPELEFTSYPRLLTIMLLSDWVFTQQPLVVARMASLVVQAPGFRILLASMMDNQSNVPLIAPERCGRGDLINECKNILTNSPRSDELRVICSALTESLTTWDVFDFWRSIKPTGQSLNGWSAIGFELKLYNELSISELYSIFCEVGTSVIYYYALRNRFDAIEHQGDTFAAAIQIALEGNGQLLIDTSSKAETPYTSRIGLALDWGSYAHLLENRAPVSARMLFDHHRIHGRRVANKLADSQPLQNIVDPILLSHCDRLLEKYDAVTELPSDTWRTSLNPWVEFVEIGLKEFGEATIFHDIALVAAGIISKVESGRLGRNLLDSTVPLCERMRFARLKSGAISWWSNQLDACDKENVTFVLRSLLFWASPRTIIRLAARLSPLVEALEESACRRLLILLERTKRERITLSDSDVKVLRQSSPRLAIIMAARASHAYAAPIINLALTTYSGTDPITLRGYADSLLGQAIHDPSKWKNALPVVRLAYKQDMILRNADELGRNISSALMDNATAMEILSSAQDYPLRLVHAAESRVTKMAGSKAKLPGEVATNERWFGADRAGQ